MWSVRYGRRCRIFTDMVPAYCFFNARPEANRAIYKLVSHDTEWLTIAWGHGKIGPSRQERDKMNREVLVQ